MLPTKPDLIVLPFKARRVGSDLLLTFDQTLACLQDREQLQITRSYPGASEASGWTIFRRTRTAYIYEEEPLFRSEHGARQHIRVAYARHYACFKETDLPHTELEPYKEKQRRTTTRL
jgi:hypothetical protein